MDNSIVREPGTRIPKIPGTSFARSGPILCGSVVWHAGAAGQSQDKVDEPNKNPVCYTFGYLKKTRGNGGEEDTVGYSGVVNVFDAHVLLFPVHSMAGLVWVSTVARLEDAGFAVSALPESWATDAVLLTWGRTDALNLGWLMLGVAGQVSVTAPDGWKETLRWQVVQHKIVLVHDALFSQIVNSNLEVRTSVAIDPERGAAEDKALFTYEALPRATFSDC